MLSGAEKRLDLLKFALRKSRISSSEYVISNSYHSVESLPMAGESGIGLTRSDGGWLVYRFDRNNRDSFSTHQNLSDAVRDIFCRLNSHKIIPRMGMYAFREEWENETGLELDLNDN